MEKNHYPGQWDIPVHSGLPSSSAFQYGPGPGTSLCGDGMRRPETYSTNFTATSVSTEIAAQPYSIGPQDQRWQQDCGPSNNTANYCTERNALLRDAVYRQHQKKVTALALENKPSSAAGVSKQPLPSSGAYLPQQSHSSQTPHQERLASFIAGIPKSASDVAGYDDEDLSSGYTKYQETLEEVFTNIREIRLSEAGKSVLEASEWLLGHVKELNLHVDDATLLKGRKQLWNQFNTAWLGIAKMQKDISESGQQIRLPQNLITAESIKKMVNDLHEYCDSINKNGLVDYQYGVLESDITDGTQSLPKLQFQLT